MGFGRRINLLPSELHPKFRPSLDRSAQAMVAFFSLYIASTILIYSIESRMQRKELESIEEQAQKIAEKIGPLLAQTKAEELQGRRLAFIESLLDRKNRWSEAFKEFGRVLPEGVWFTGLASVAADGKRSFLIKGQAVSPVKMADFLSALERSRFFGGASIDYSEKEPNIEPEIYRFEFSVPIRADSKGDSA